MLPCRFNPPMLAFVFLPHVSPLRPPLSPLSSVRCTRTAVATRPPREARAPVCVCVSVRFQAVPPQGQTVKTLGNRRFAFPKRLVPNRASSALPCR